MKKISLKVAVCLMAGSFLFSSCMVGSWGLFNKYADWQTHMTSNKFVNAVVGFVLGAVCYPVSSLVDALVLNTIEFWTGDNPVASNIGKTQSVMGQDGRLYAVKTLKNGYEVTDPNGVVTLFTYNKKENSWSMSQNGLTKEIFRFNEDGKSIKVTMNGEERDFTLNEQGVIDAEYAATTGLYFAAL
ncbi:MAG: DUF3332 domain-containing protein [Prevotella sp.]|jgi:hypothetical protein|nr:DUF3332 domain-containing protein [Prevotella sp.]MBO7129937.1 DUF3332 domain-containing protein [Prevotella sp.]